MSNPWMVDIIPGVWHVHVMAGLDGAQKIVLSVEFRFHGLPKLWVVAASILSSSFFGVVECFSPIIVLCEEY